MTHHTFLSKGNDVDIAGHDYQVRYFVDEPGVRCELRHRHPNKEVDIALSGLGFGETHSQAWPMLLKRAKIS